MDLRREIYSKNHFLDEALRCFKTSKHINIGTMANLIGYEFNIYCAEELIKQGHKPRFEIPVQDTFIDVLYNNTAIECKAVRDLARTKVIKQIKKYKTGKYQVVVFILKDTIVSSKIGREIERYGEIERAEIERKDLIDRINEIICSS